MNNHESLGAPTLKNKFSRVLLINTYILISNINSRAHIDLS